MKKRQHRPTSKAAHNRRDLKGQRFGKLLVIEFMGRNKDRKAMWKCQCDCGTTKIVSGKMLRLGKTQSCGCYRVYITLKTFTKHGQSRPGRHTPEHTAWMNMKARCNNPKNKRYKDWGGRGIRVCPRWMSSFENFFLDMGSRPSKKHSIDRYPNNDGNYEPGNCRWATRKQQANNTRKINSNEKKAA